MSTVSLDRRSAAVSGFVESLQEPRTPYISPKRFSAALGVQVVRIFRTARIDEAGEQLVGSVVDGLRVGIVRANEQAFPHLLVVVERTTVIRAHTNCREASDKAAIEALKEWRYSPLVLDGVPMSFILTVTFNFSVQ